MHILSDGIFWFLVIVFFIVERIPPYFTILFIVLAFVMRRAGALPRIAVFTFLMNMALFFRK
jgi:hypothetical protein